MRDRSGKGIMTAVTICVLLIGQNCSLIVRTTAQAVPVTSNPVGARIIVDGKDAGQTPMSLTLKRNKSHTVRIEKDGYNPTELRVTRKMTARLAVEVLAVPVIAVATGLSVFLAQLILTKAEKSWTEYSNTYETIVWVTGAVAAAAVIADTASGANNTLTPRTLDVVLTKAEGPEPLRVNIINLDGTQLAGVRWIRIRAAGEESGADRRD
jgi:hypothetical protein